MEERYEPMKELGSGNFGVARLVRDKKTKELVAVKYIERGKKVTLSTLINRIMHGNSAKCWCLLTCCAFNFLDEFNLFICW